MTIINSMTQLRDPTVMLLIKESKTDKDQDSISRVNYSNNRGGTQTLNFKQLMKR
jgi:hypothetical protein